MLCRGILNEFRFSAEKFQINNITEGIALYDKLLKNWVFPLRKYYSSIKYYYYQTNNVSCTNEIYYNTVLCVVCYVIMQVKHVYQLQLQ